MRAGFHPTDSCASPSANGAVIMVLKVTENCNATCDYCTYSDRGTDAGQMSLNLLEALFVRIDEYLADNPEAKIELLWHGGEPLLPGPAYYRSAIRLLSRHCRETNGRIRSGIQTNLTCCNEEFVPIFRQMGIASVGTSYDPEPDIRRIGRRGGSETYNRRFMEGLSVLHRNGIGWHVGYVVTRRSLDRPLDMFRFLANLSPVGGFSMSPVLIPGDQEHELAITPEEYVEFLGAIFPDWWRHRTRYPSVQPFEGLTRAIVEHGELSGYGGGGICDVALANMVVAPDGEVSQNGFSSRLTLPVYGSILETPLGEMLNHNKMDFLIEQATRLRERECGECRFQELCHAGAAGKEGTRRGSLVVKSEWCRARTGFIERYLEPITGVPFGSQN